jgi:chemotaxis protein CheD
MALLVVGIGDCKVSDNPSDILVTHALGSCIAVLLYDPVARVAGLLHFMLPDSSLDSEKACKLPSLFADTGIALLLRRSGQLGAAKPRIVITAAGGAQMLDAAGIFNIGQRNHLAMKKVFAEAGIGIQKEEIGGTCSRTISIDVANGRVQLRTPGKAGQTVAVVERNSWQR